MTPARRLAVVALGAVGALAASQLGGCDRPVPTGEGPATTETTEASVSPAPRPAPTSRPLATAATATVATATVGRTGFPENIAAPCAGRPSGDQIVLLVRRSLNLPANANLTVRTGPLCAGTWQYTVIVQPGLDPLEVVTRGAPGALTLVTAGSDVCTAEVKAGAPYGIQTAAHC
jgi:hypothetical protein